MKNLFKIVAITGLCLTLLPPLLAFSDRISMDASKQLMFVGFLAWFCAAPFWMKK